MRYASTLRYASECCHELPTNDGEYYLLDKCSSCRGDRCEDCKGSGLTNPANGICSNCKKQTDFLRAIPVALLCPPLWERP